MPATNRKADWNGITIYRLADDKLAEWWNQSTFSAVVQQLGQSKEIMMER